MTRLPRPEIRVFEGPSLLASFAAVVVEFASPYALPLATAKVTNLLASALSPALMKSMALPSGQVAFEHLVALLANALQDLRGPCELPVGVQYTDTGSARIVIGFYDPLATVQACETAMRIAFAVFTAEVTGTNHVESPAAMVKLTSDVMKLRQPDSVARHIMRAARARGIPVYAVSPGSRQWRYGQGAAGCVFFRTGSQRDSFTGTVLAKNKLLTNQFVTRLGLPGVEHGIAYAPEAAARIAGRLGFPVVIKPVDGSSGLGVSANITTFDELQAAFAKASAATKQGVLVERHIPGDDHRIAVVGGNLKWVTQRQPPRVVGNGQNTLAELIDLENRNRAAAKQLVIDTDMRTMFAKQGLTLEDRPTAGRSVSLSSIANTSTGGTIVDCTTNIHPDNREMAETIARSVHMDVLGIDFITTDIAKSWREGAGAVTEINPMPGFSSSQGRADTILADKFPSGGDGRLPSIVLIGADAEFINRVTAVVETLVDRVGQTDGGVTLLAGKARCRETDPLPARVLALLLDPSCQALIVGTTPQEIERHGFPLDRCDLSLIVEPTSISTALRRLIDNCSEEVIDGVSGQNLDGFLPSIAAKIAANIQRHGG